jgi:hypothetical protein
VTVYTLNFIIPRQIYLSLIIVNCRSWVLNVVYSSVKMKNTRSHRKKKKLFCNVVDFYWRLLFNQSNCMQWLLHFDNEPGGVIVNINGYQDRPVPDGAFLCASTHFSLSNDWWFTNVDARNPNASSDIKMRVCLQWKYLIDFSVFRRCFLYSFHSLISFFWSNRSGHKIVRRYCLSGGGGYSPIDCLACFHRIWIVVNCWGPSSDVRSFFLKIKIKLKPNAYGLSLWKSKRFFKN